MSNGLKASGGGDLVATPNPVMETLVTEPAMVESVSIFEEEQQSNIATMQIADKNSQTEESEQQPAVGNIETKPCMNVTGTKSEYSNKEHPDFNVDKDLLDMHLSTQLYEDQTMHNIKSVIVEGDTTSVEPQVPGGVAKHLCSVELDSNGASSYLTGNRMNNSTSTPIGVGAASLFSAEHNIFQSGGDMANQEKHSSDGTSIVNGPSQHIISYEPQNGLQNFVRILDNENKNQLSQSENQSQQTRVEKTKAHYREEAQDEGYLYSQTDCLEHEMDLEQQQKNEPERSSKF